MSAKRDYWVSINIKGEQKPHSWTVAQLESWIVGQLHNWTVGQRIPICGEIVTKIGS